MNKAQAWYNYVETNIVGNVDKWQLTLDNAKNALDAAQIQYDNVLAGYNTQDVAIKKMQVQAGEMSLAAAQENAANVATNIAINEQQVTLNQGKVADAQKSLADAQEKLATAQGMSPEITAPFDGFVTAVNVKAGDNVYNGTIAVTMADPNKFEADILVNEMDILKVSLGENARVQLSAIPGVNLPANVTHICRQLPFSQAW